MDKRLLGYKSYEDLYLDWINNFVTIQKFASYHGIMREEAEELVNRGRECFSKKEEK